MTLRNLFLLYFTAEDSGKRWTGSSFVEPRREDYFQRREPMMSNYKYAQQSAPGTEPAAPLPEVPGRRECDPQCGLLTWAASPDALQTARDAGAEKALTYVADWVRQRKEENRARFGDLRGEEEGGDDAFARGRWEESCDILNLVESFDHRALEVLKRINCDTGDWLGQIMFRIPNKGAVRPNETVDSQVTRASRVLHADLAVEAAYNRAADAFAAWLRKGDVLNPGPFEAHLRAGCPGTGTVSK